MTTAWQNPELLVSQIKKPYVSPQYQRKRIGSKLLEESIIAFPWMKKLLLEVKGQYKQGVLSYQEHGFKEVFRKEERVEDEFLW